MIKKTMLPVLFTIIWLLAIPSRSMAGDLFWIDLETLEGTRSLSGPHVAFVERTRDNHKTRCALYIINSAGYTSTSRFTDTDNDGGLDVTEIWAGRVFLEDWRYEYPVRPYFLVQSGVPNSAARRDYQTLLQAADPATQDEIWGAVRNLLRRP